MVAVRRVSEGFVLFGVVVDEAHLVRAFNVHLVDLAVAVPVAREGYVCAIGQAGTVSSRVLEVSCVRFVPLGFIVKISESPVGLSTPGPLVRSLSKTILPFSIGNAA